MREIKFRAWDSKNKIMITQSYRTTSEVISEARQYKWELMQFTGLKDKNGKEIYEGDIVKTYWRDFTGHNYSVVEYIPEKTGFCYFGNKSHFEEGSMKEKIFYHLEAFGSHRLEVVGNLYENPKLLK